MGEPATIGVLADTHCEPTELAALPPAVLDVLRGSELIVHCGDIISRDTLDALADVAPVVAVRSPADPPAESGLLFEPPHVLECRGRRIGLLSRPADLPGHADLASGPGTDVAALAARAADIFGTPVDVVLYRGSHHAHVDVVGDLLLVDPGSPTFWAGRSATLGRLHLGEGRPRYEVVDVTRRLPAAVRRRWVLLRRWRGLTMGAYEVRSALLAKVRPSSSS